MTSFYSVLLPIVAAALVGCSSTPRAKQHFSADDIHNAALLEYLHEACGQKGLMSLETAAYGSFLLNSYMQNYQIDMEEFARNRRVVRGYRVDQENCNTMSLQILAVKAKEDAQQSKSSGSISETPYMPRTTTCNTYFGQTYCTSY
jgi:hypothetical protein